MIRRLAAALLWLSPLLAGTATAQGVDRRAWNGVRAAAQLAAAGHQQSAQRVLSVALAIDPDASEALFLSAQWQGGNRSATATARRLLERAVAAASWVETTPLAAANVLAALHVRTRQPQRAVALLQPLLDDPLTQHPELRTTATVTLAGAYLAMGRPSEAAEVARGGLRRTPADVELHVAAAAVAAAVDGDVAARTQLERGAIAAPGDRRLRLALAAAATRVGAGQAALVRDATALAKLLPREAVPPPDELRPQPLQEAGWLGAVLLAAVEQAVVASGSADGDHAGEADSGAGAADGALQQVVRAILASGAAAHADVIAGLHRLLASAATAATAATENDGERAESGEATVPAAAEAGAALGDRQPALGHPPGATGALAELDRWLAGFSGFRYLDADRDGYWEERLQFAEGALVSWMRDANQDGEGELTLELATGRPALVSTPGITLGYGAYPLLAVARVASGEFDGEWLLRPGALSLSVAVRGAADAAAGILGGPPVTVEAPPFPSFVAIREASYLRRQWREGRLWAVTSRLDTARSLRREDADGDGRFERVVVLRERRPTRAVSDLDGDGHAEVTEIFVGGRLDRVEYDGNRDGIADAQIDVAAGYGVAWDLNGDGLADVRERTLAGGARVREFSTRLDGMFDSRTELP